MIQPLLRIMIVDELLEQQQTVNLINNLEKHRNLVILSVHDFNELHFDILASIDLVILETKASQFDGFKLISHIKTQNFNTKTLIYSSMDERVFAMPYLKNGASGYLQKKNATELWLAISLILKGKIYSSEQIKEEAINAELSNTNQTLTRRDATILMLLFKGFDNDFIAKYLLVSEIKIESITSKVLKRLRINNIKLLDTRM